MKKIFVLSALLAGVIANSAVGEAKETAPKPKHSSKTREVIGTPIPVASKEVVATSSEAKTPGLEISGGTSFNAYAFKNKRRQENNGKGRGTHFGVDDSRINFLVFGKAGPELNGLEYSALLGMTGNMEDGTTAIEENWVQLKNRWGTLRAGGHRGVTDFMAVGAFNFLGATGGILGNYKAVVNETSGAVIRDDLKGVAKDQNKITYVTPRYHGVQVGYSYTPDGNQKGEAKLATSAALKSGKVVPVGSNIHEFGINYKKTFENSFGVEASATSVMGRAKNTKGLDTYGRRNINSYALGLVFTYKGFSLGGEYLDNGKSLEWKNLTGNDAGKVYTIGTGYSWDRHAVTLAHLYSKRKLGRSKTGAVDYGHTKSNVTSVTYDYKVAPGLKLYGEALTFNYRAKNDTLAKQWHTDSKAKDDAVGSNNGHALIGGIAIAF